MIALDITSDEVSAGQLTQEHLKSAVDAICSEGFVVLKDIVDPSHLDFLRQRMLQDVDVILQREDAPFNFNKGNVQQDPPPHHPFLFRDVLLNDLVAEVSRAVLGPNPKNSFYSGNTALPGGDRQPVHPDVAQLWPNLQHPTPAFGLVVNIPVVDVSPENGSTEIWPGSHLDTTYDVHQGSARIAEADLERQRAVTPPIQPSLGVGSVLIRDIRLWHAGMPNHTQQPRPMIAMIHWCSWWANNDPIVFPQGTEEFFTHPILHTNAKFVPGEVNYLHHNHAYDLEK